MPHTPPFQSVQSVQPSAQLPVPGTPSGTHLDDDLDVYLRFYEDADRPNPDERFLLSVRRELRSTRGPLLSVYGFGTARELYLFAALVLEAVRRDLPLPVPDAALGAHVETLLDAVLTDERSER